MAHDNRLKYVLPESIQMDGLIGLKNNRFILFSHFGCFQRAVDLLLLLLYRAPGPKYVGPNSYCMAPHGFACTSPNDDLSLAHNPRGREPMPGFENGLDVATSSPAGAGLGYPEIGPGTRGSASKPTLQSMAHDNRLKYVLPESIQMDGLIGLKNNRFILFSHFGCFQRAVDLLLLLLYRAPGPKYVGPNSYCMAPHGFACTSPNDDLSLAHNPRGREPMPGFENGLDVATSSPAGAGLGYPEIGPGTRGSCGKAG